MINLILAAFLMQSPSASAGPILVGRGAGQSEYALIFTRLHLAELLASCRGSACQLSPDQDRTLETLIARAENAPKPLFADSTLLGTQLFQFKSDQVWFNQDLLWQNADKTLAYDEAAAALVWTDVLALIPSPQPAADVTAIKTELQKVLSQHLIRIVSSPNPQLAFEALLFQPQVGSSDKFFLRDPGFQNFELTSVLSDLAVCSDGPAATDLRFHSARWSSIEQPSPGSLSLSLELIQSWSCGADATRARVLLTMQAGTVDGGLQLDPKSVRAYLQGE